MFKVILILINSARLKFRTYHSYSLTKGNSWDTDPLGSLAPKPRAGNILSLPVINKYLILNGTEVIPASSVFTVNKIGKSIE